MRFTIDIDTGGTFTDGFFARGGDWRTIKTPTTPHDLTVCFAECIKEGARAFGLSPEELLREAEVVRFSNTIGTNCIINRDGARLGLLVTAGQEALAPTADPEDKPPLIAPDMVLGIAERAGGQAPSPEAVVAAAQELVDRGARCLVVAFAGSDRDPANERAARAAIKHEYPREYLGSVPVFLASDISERAGDPERLNAALLNAYIHGKLARLLYKAGEDLRRRDYAGTLLIGHNNGAAARVAKTRAINTYNSGPAAGLLGAREIGALYGADCVLSADMGGTSFDVGYVKGGGASYALRPDVEGFRCNLPMLAIRAIGAGGGSIAAVRDGALAVGPRSAGALPGPACFGLGGTDATVTDANLLLGLLDPHWFLGGSRRLDIDKASAAVTRAVAGPLAQPVEQAAARIVETVEAAMGGALAEMAAEARADDPLMVIYGGGGPLHACKVAERAGVSRIVVTPFSAVFSAYSSSLMDVGHLYYRRTELALRPLADLAPVAAIVAELRRKAEADMRGEGVAAEQLHWSLELIVEAAGSGRETKLVTSPDFHHDHASVEALSRAAAAAIAPGTAEDLVITALGLCASAPVPHFRLQPVPTVETTAADAERGCRRVYDRAHGWRDLPVYDRARLGHGHGLAGPALVESEQTTLLVADGWRLTVDRFNNILLERAA